MLCGSSAPVLEQITVFIKSQEPQSIRIVSDCVGYPGGKTVAIGNAGIIEGLQKGEDVLYLCIRK